MTTNKIMFFCRNVYYGRNKLNFTRMLSCIINEYQALVANISSTTLTICVKIYWIKLSSTYSFIITDNYIAAARSEKELVDYILKQTDPLSRPVTDITSIVTVNVTLQPVLIEDLVHTIVFLLT